MYRIDFNDLQNAAEIMYCFMTVSSLYNPECTIWGTVFPETVVNDGADFMTEADFCNKIVKSKAEAITCVASTNRSDTRRVVLSLMPDTDYLVLNFPSSNGKLSTEEQKLIMLLEECDG